MTIKIAHDIVCPWCWIAISQARKLNAEFGVQFEWVGHELYPPSMDLPPPSAPAVPVATNRPPTPSRLELAYAAEGMTPPNPKPPYPVRSHLALQACAHAQAEGVPRFIESVYLAYWQSGIDIESVDALVKVGLDVGLDETRLRAALSELRYADQILPYDDASYAAGVYNVPTFFIGGERYAEQPYAVLRAAVKEALAAQ